MGTNKSYSEQFKLIKQDVRKTYDAITRDLTKQAKKDLTHATYSVIEDFYNTYNPNYYVRTKNLYNMVSQRPIYRQDNGYIASIVTSSLFMFDNYNCSPEWVYNLMWNEGHRGLPFQNLLPTWKPQAIINDVNYIAGSPHSVMLMFVRNWGNKIGKKKINEIDKRYKSNNYISF